MSLPLLSKLQVLIAGMPLNWSAELMEGMLGLMSSLYVLGMPNAMHSAISLARCMEKPVRTQYAAGTITAALTARVRAQATLLLLGCSCSAGC